MIFYLDADIPVAVRSAIAACRSDVLYAGQPDAPAVDALDQEWLPRAGREGWVVITRDKRFRHRAAERQAVIDYKVRLFVLTSAGNLTRWDTLDLLVRRWSEITVAAENNSGPFICGVIRHGLRPIEPDDFVLPPSPQRQRTPAV